MDELLLRRSQELSIQDRISFGDGVEDESGEEKEKEKEERREDADAFDGLSKRKALHKGKDFKPLDTFANPLLTDMYQLTMAYAYWVHDKHEQHAVFDLFFRSCPFDGEFAIFAGLEEVVLENSTHTLSSSPLVH
jgi:hypothetical protein